MFRNLALLGAIILSLQLAREGGRRREAVTVRSFLEELTYE